MSGWHQTPATALLILADGTRLEGRGIGAVGHAAGEVCFNTAMTGYQEILTDPSYAGQIITFTFPHIGNVGTNDEDIETVNMAALSGVRGCVLRADITNPSNYRAVEKLDAWLKKRNIIGIAGTGGCVMSGAVDEPKALAAARAFPGLAGMDLAKEVTTREPYEWREGRWALGTGYRVLDNPTHHVVAYDYGIKRNILRLLAERGARVTVVPAQTPAREVLRMQPDGVFLSNGPGDPEPCDYAIAAIKEILAKKVPTFGICLGHQLLALASGAKTMKMGTGHHGANHPVKDIDSGQVLITSQNHGFAVDPATMPANLRVTHVSLFDGTNQGIERTDVPAFSFQGHPEASPGPQDVAYLFDRFIKLMEAK